jgi:hypothetical protein
MADIIPIHGAPINGVKPKSESRQFGGHRYTLMFDTNAPPERRWFWTVKYTRIYEYIGAASTIQRAAKEAERKIGELLSYEGRTRAG